MPKQHVTSVRLDEWQHQSLARHAAKQDRSVSYLVNAALNIYLREQGYSPLDVAPSASAAPAPVVTAEPTEAPVPASTRRAQETAEEFTRLMKEPRPEAEDPKAKRRKELAAKRRAAQYSAH